MATTPTSSRLKKLPNQFRSALKSGGQRVLRSSGWARSWLRDLPLPGAAVLAAAGLLAVALFVLWLTGRPKGGDLRYWYIEEMVWKDRLTYAAAVATGVGALVALVVAYRKQRDAEEGKFAAQFAAAAAQLGDDAPAVRIAGVYALAALADRHRERRQQCIDVLTGYLRLPYEPGTGHISQRTAQHAEDTGGIEFSITNTESYRPADREVRFTIIRVIRDHLHQPDDASTWCGYDLDFTEAIFDGGDFTQAVFTGGHVTFDRAEFRTGTVNFRWVQFRGGLVTFNGAKFGGGRVTFNAAAFSGGSVTFTGAVFSGGSVTFRGAKFRGGTIGFHLAKFSGGGVTFEGSAFCGANVDFEWAQFESGRVTFQQAKFSGGDVAFKWADFSGGEVSFDKTELSGGSLTFEATDVHNVVRDGEPFFGWREEVGLLPRPDGAVQ